LNNIKVVAEVIYTVIGNGLTQLLDEQSNLYHTQNTQLWKVSPKRLQWANFTALGIKEN
jgi:hypothetical protein